VPRITLDTLGYLTGTKHEDLADHLAPLALTPGQLDAVRIPVTYLASSRDEIIPASEIRHLAAHVPDLRVMENDDVHASPRYLAESLVWLVLSVLRLTGRRDPRRVVVAALWHLLRARHRLSRGSR
jgi:hypothetical protein